MKKALLLSLLLAQPALAQEAETAVEAPPFWTDPTFLWLAGGALFLIIVLIVKKVLDRRNNSDDYEDTNI